MSCKFDYDLSYFKFNDTYLEIQSGNSRAEYVENAEQ